MKTKLAIFDLDGTLFNTDNVNYKAYREALRPYGLELDREYFVKYCNGRHYKEFVPKIMGNSDHLEEVHDKKKEYYKMFLDEAVMNSHLFAIIDAIRDSYYTAVVTTASRKNVEDILGRFGVRDSFDYCITQEDIHKPKPDPEGFLLAMEHFNVEPKDTVIFEDSDVGIEAARASGAAVFVADRF
ncbi:MAG: HAD family phosphatase [Lachnospiraceae bacterium]|nr:HAD family phosphatase [Lachnospiraceae bacterium]